LSATDDKLKQLQLSPALHVTLGHAPRAMLAGPAANALKKLNGFVLVAKVSGCALAAWLDRPSASCALTGVESADVPTTATKYTAHSKQKRIDDRNLTITFPLLLVAALTIGSRLFTWRRV
jgi:hypothetical protein